MTKATSAVIGNDVTDVNIASNSIAQRHIKANAVGTEQVANASITGAKVALASLLSQNYANSSVTTEKLADSSLTTAKYADASITGPKLVTNAINTNHYTNSSITTEKLADGSLTSIKYADGSILTAKVADRQITGIKIANATVQPENLNSAGNGEMLVGANGQYTRLAKGGNNSVLSIDANGILGWGNSVIPTGVITDYIGLSVPTGWIFANGKTIGSAASSASAVKGDTVYNLYVLLWNSLYNDQAPVIGGRGSSASADWAANKPLTLPDFRGRVGVGMDSMGFSSAMRINLEAPTPNVLGTVGGNQQIELDILSLPKHDHKMFIAFSNGSESNLGVDSYVLERAATYNESKYSMATRPGLGQPTNGRTSYAGGDNASSTGKGKPHSNMQPFILVNKIIKL